MPLRRVVFASLCFFALAGPAPAQQQSGNGITVEHKEIGEIKIQVQKYDHALGVVTQLSRSPKQNIECNGLCYLQNGNKAIAWTCGPVSLCHLYCTVSPPVGGCN